MQKEVQRILNHEEIVSAIQKLKDELLEKTKQLDTIQSNCNHEVIIFINKGFSLSDGYHLSKKCIFCGCESFLMFPPGNCSIIDITDFNQEDFINPEDKFNFIKSLYIEKSNMYPELSISEIVNIIKQDLNNKS